jgi:hypothetical protein
MEALGYQFSSQKPDNQPYQTARRAKVKGTDPNGLRGWSATGCRSRAPAVHRTARRGVGVCLRLGASLIPTPLGDSTNRSAPAVHWHCRKVDGRHKHSFGASGPGAYFRNRACFYGCLVYLPRGFLVMRGRPARSRVAAALAAFAAASLSSPGSRVSSHPVIPIRTRSACLMVFT